MKLEKDTRCGGIVAGSKCNRLLSHFNLIKLLTINTFFQRKSFYLYMYVQQEGHIIPKSR